MDNESRNSMEGTGENNDQISKQAENETRDPELVQICASQPMS